MPFYFAIPRKGNTSTQARSGTGRTDYVRTVPSTLAYISYSFKPRIVTFLAENIHAVLFSAVAGQVSKVYDKCILVDLPSIPIFQNIPNDEEVPIPLPPISIRVDEGDNGAKDTMRDLGFEERNVKGKGTLFMGEPTSDNIRRILEVEVIPEYTPLGGTVSYRGLVAFRAFRKIITAVAKGLDLAFSQDLGGVRAVSVVEHGELKEQQLRKISLKASANADPEGVFVRDVDGYLADTSVIAHYPTRVIFGEAKNITEVLSNGIFCPFEPNYSGTDRAGAAHFLSEFACVVADYGSIGHFEQELLERWTDELCLTQEGEYMAHIMCGLKLAKKVYARPFIIMSGDKYEGLILHGAEEFTVRLMGGSEVHSVNGATVLGEIADYSFHTKALEKIIDRFGLVGATPQVVTSMRQLRKLILGSRGQAIPEQDKQWLRREIFFLNFRERPVNVNPASLGQFFSFIDPVAPTAVPDTVYLDRAAFFSAGLTEVALAMFGKFAPSPTAHGTRYFAATTSGSSDKVSSAPVGMSMVFKELAVAATDWDNFLRGGIAVFPTTKPKRARHFSKQESQDIWSAMCSLASKSFTKRVSDRVAGRADQVKERRDRDDEGRESTRKKARLSTLDFGVFASMDLS